MKLHKVAYVYNITRKKSFAGRTIALGFRNAFEIQGNEFSFFDLEKLKYPWFNSEKSRIVSYSPSLIFTSVENLKYLPLDELPNVKLVLWGQFYSTCTFEKQLVTISDETKKLLVKNRDKHSILIWSQHSTEINERFFSGYQYELGLKFEQILHCADSKNFKEPILEPEFDFLWIGNVGHRRKTYDDFIVPLKKQYSNFLEFTERNMIEPSEVENKNLYSRSFIAPNIHTPAQIKHNILINERVFTSTLMGGFQICDNELASQYFNKDELVIVKNKSEFRDVIEYYHKHPTERVEMIKKMQNKIIEQHTYSNRISQILNRLKEN